MSNNMEHITIKASEGKVFRRIADGVIFGNEITLGYTHYLNGKKLDSPKWEVPSDFEEIDEPKDDVIEEETIENEEIV